MTRAEVEELIGYSAWANARMLDACAALTAEDFSRDLGSSFPSVRDTLVHIMSGDWVWLSRWQGRSPTGFPEAWQHLDLAGIRTQWQQIERERAAFLMAQGDDGLAATVSYRSFAGDPFTSPLAQLVRHIVNHATYHRGQVTTMLRQLGAAAPATDLVAYQRLQQQAQLRV